MRIVLNSNFTFRDRSVVVRVDEYDWQTFLWQVKLVLEDGGQLLGVFPLSDSPEKINDQRDTRPVSLPLQSVTRVERVEAPEVDEDDDITPEVSKHLRYDSEHDRIA